MDTSKLTAQQRERFEQVRREAVQGGRPVRDLLLCDDMPAEDRAAIADAFTPGAGAGYLR